MKAVASTSSGGPEVLQVQEVEPQSRRRRCPDKDRGSSSKPGRYVTEKGIVSVGKNFTRWTVGDEVFKGKKMPGRMGGKQCTVKNVWVYKIDPARNLMWVKGLVPGAEGNFVFIKNAVYKKPDISLLPFPTHFIHQTRIHQNYNLWLLILVK